MNERLNKILESMAGRRILVVGDVMMDEYVWGNARRISPEAPVMVVEVERESYTPGGAANVVNNIQALGGISSVAGVVGEDEVGRKLMKHLSEAGVDVSGIVTDATRPTTRKTRIIAHSQQVVRVDRENRKTLTNRAASKLISRLEELIALADAVVFSDYDKGVARRQVTQSLLDIAAKHGKKVIVNPKPRNVRQFKSASVISLNQSEAEAVTGVTISDGKSLQRAAKKLIASLQPECLLITCGPNGMSLFNSNGDMETIPAHLVEVYDVAGAGDTVVSVLALALAAGATPHEAAVLANCAGGAVVRKVGVAAVTREEIASMMEQE